MAVRYSFNQLRLNNLLRLSHSLYSFQRTQKRSMADQIIKDIKFGDLEMKLKNQAITLVDVREPKELKEDGKIPHSVNIPLGEIDNAFQLPDSTFQSKYGIPKPSALDEFVLSCKSGKRATKAFTKVLPLGYKNALVYLGSFQDWVQNGGIVEKD